MTTLRSSWAVVGAAESAPPHSEQNFAPSALACPHAGQELTAEAYDRVWAGGGRQEIIPGMRPFRWLAWFALAVVIGQHAGVLFKPLGSAGRGTEWADWIDLLTPYAVIGTALATMLAAEADRRTWLLAALAAIAYAEGGGIHLAANSVGNARGNAQPVHLWDEVVGHYLSYTGLYLLVTALALALLTRPRPARLWVPLAVLFGLTMANNGIEGGTPYYTLAVSLAFVGWGWRHRHGSGWLLVTAYGVAFLLLAGWGLYWGIADGRSFPQFSELGWI